MYHLICVQMIDHRKAKIRPYAAIVGTLRKFSTTKKVIQSKNIAPKNVGYIWAQIFGKKWPVGLPKMT